MTKIKPFKAIIYNQDKLNNLSSVVCPPYDIIPPQAQKSLHDASPYNFIHILFGKDISGEDKYKRAAIYFKDWLKNEILVQDERPAIYFYSQQYKVKGEKKTRLGFISLLHLQDKNSIYAHENTRLAPKEDRFKLIKQVKANLSPIFVVFKDNKRIIQRVYKQYIQEKKPFIDIVDDEGVTHKLWRIDSPETLGRIQSSLAGENIFIADGHHRYEVACAYRDLRKKKLSAFTGEESFNYVMSYFTNTDISGLTILPIHRLVKLDTTPDLDRLKLSLKEYFDIDEVKDKTRFFFLMEKGGRTEHVLGMYKDKKYFLLRLKNIKILDKLIADKPKEYRSLDVSIFNHIILKEILGCNLEDKDNLTFSAQAQEFIDEADRDPLAIAFFLNPVKIQDIIAVALNGNKMPPKSTYFYPKVWSGLVVNKFD
ncbi:MAG: DUF1015 domain-containing protein [Candidatus Omnitrophica bacterium]|nr:DUF1015 domain-containing protein [Candidatus Omnitrophota bacterium]